MKQLNLLFMLDSGLFGSIGATGIKGETGATGATGATGRPGYRKKRQAAGCPGRSK